MRSVRVALYTENRAAFDIVRYVNEDHWNAMKSVCSPINNRFMNRFVWIDEAHLIFVWASISSEYVSSLGQENSTHWRSNNWLIFCIRNREQNPSYTTTRFALFRAKLLFCVHADNSSLPFCSSASFGKKIGIIDRIIRCGKQNKFLRSQVPLATRSCLGVVWTRTCVEHW